jgi:hypothetical protein
MWVNAFLNKALKRWILLIANEYFRIMELPKFLISVYLCVLRGELFFYHRGHGGSQRFFVFSPCISVVKVFY